MGEAAPKYKYSIEEYLEMEANSLEKFEYHEGEIFAMAGGNSKPIKQLLLFLAISFLY